MIPDGEGMLILADEVLLPSKRRFLRVGTRFEGELRLLGAPGHPQAEWSARRVADSGEV